MAASRAVGPSQARAEGVDTSADTLSEGLTRAIERGVQDRLTLHPGDVTEFSSPHRFDLVISVGAAYAFGGLLPTLAAAHRHLAPGGAVLIGDGFWLRDPTPAAVEMLGESFVGLSTMVDRVVDAGWVPLDGHVSTRQELDGYEWAWTGSGPRGHSTIPMTRTAPTSSRRRRRTAPSGCTPIERTGGSSASS